MFAALFLSGALLTLTQGAKPPDYTELSLCQVWAGAQCHLAECQPDGKQRCVAESKRCRRQGRATVSKEHASKVVECSRAILKQKCGAPPPADCADLPLP